MSLAAVLRRRSNGPIDEGAFVANLSHTVERTDLSETLCFDLCATGRAVTRAYRPLLLSVGLTYPQYLVARAMSQRAPRTVTELGDRLALDSCTLSPLLNRLDASCLITVAGVMRTSARSRSRSRRKERPLHEAEGVPTRVASVMGLSAEAITGSARFSSR